MAVETHHIKSLYNWDSCKPVSVYYALICRRGPVKYKYQALYELDSLAVVNVKDVGPMKNAFKVLMFPDTRMYQAENPKAKVLNYFINI